MRHWSVEPDISTLGKGIGSGYAALGAVVASAKVVAAFRDGSGTFRHGFTYSGLPVSCFVGLKVLDHVLGEDLFDRAASLGTYLEQQLKALARAHAEIGDVRVLGLLAGLEFVADQQTRMPIESTVRYAQRVVEETAKRGVLLRAGTSGSNYGQGETRSR
jgi:adenosylmethionine-8-amino-7-oxononanoate aminotransferase